MPFPLNNLWPLQENSGGFVHSFTRRQTETGALTKVADGGKVHSVAGSRFTVAVLRADYRVTSVSSGPAFRRWWHLTPALCGRRLNCSGGRSKTLLSRSGGGSPRSARCLKAGEAVLLSQALPLHITIQAAHSTKDPSFRPISFGFELYKCEIFIFVENKGWVQPNQSSVAFIDSYHWS